MRKKVKKNNSQEYSHKSSNSNVFHYKKEVETVLKLNFNPYNVFESFRQNNQSLSPNKPLINNNINMDNSINSNDLDNSNNNNIDNKFEKELNKFTHSLKQLKTYFPNNIDLIKLEQTAGVKIPTRIEHSKIENKLKEQILSYEKEENDMRIKKEKIEKELLNIDKEINDEQLNIQVVMGFEKENNNKIIRDKLISKFEQEYKNENKTKKKNFMNSKEFLDELDIFIQREEYNTKQKAKEIENNISIIRNKKKEINEKLNLVINDLRNIHKNKNSVIQKLYYHYLNLLHDGKDTRNEGLSWIIREIFSLDKKVMLSYMPEFLDKLCIKYLFDMTHLNIEISDFEKQIKLCKEGFKRVDIINKGNDFLIKDNIIKNDKNNTSNKFFDEKNEIMSEYLDKIRQTFCFNSNKNIKIYNSRSYIQKNKNINKNNIKRFALKNRKSIFTLPFINGDPNSLTKSNRELAYTNKLLKEELNEQIPNVLKVKDLEQMIKNTGDFMNGEEIKKVQNYLKLNKKLNNLRKKKENMKLNEMTRIFKEFQRNDYAQRFNIDKISVISALIGEDNVNSELIKQAKREKKYIEEIMKGRMHKKITSSEKSFSVKNIYGSNNLSILNKTYKNMVGFENIKNNEDYEKRYNSFGNNHDLD